MVAPEKLQDTPPKKLLSLDGGGIRGMMSVEVLARIESLLREHYGRPHMTLSDYFDYIAGTSTGAIIATALATGMSVDELRAFYVNNGAEMFDRAGLFHRFLHHRFESEKLANRLKAVLGEKTTLGSDNLKTLLMIVLRNASTDSPWPLSNHPLAKYSCDASDPQCNLNLPLWQLVRASTAAPTYFPPEVIRIGPAEHVFVDGGITMYNNPAFQLFLMATLEPYRCCWTPGEDRMLLVSIGTGTADDANRNLQPAEMNVLYNASSLPSALMNAALHEQDLLCRVFGRCLEGRPIDREIGDLRSETKTVVPAKLFTYVRYNAELTRTGFDELARDAGGQLRIGPELADRLQAIDPTQVRRLDSVEHIDKLQVVGRAVGEALVRKEHFAKFLDGNGLQVQNS